MKKLSTSSLLSKVETGYSNCGQFVNRGFDNKNFCAKVFRCGSNVCEAKRGRLELRNRKFGTLAFANTEYQCELEQWKLRRGQFKGVCLDTGQRCCIESEISVPMLSATPRSDFVAYSLRTCRACTKLLFQLHGKFEFLKS